MGFRAQAPGSGLVVLYRVEGSGFSVVPRHDTFSNLFVSWALVVSWARK